MELIVFASLYQAKERHFLRPFFVEELSIYVARQSGIRSLLYIKKGFGGEKFVGLRTLSEAPRLHEAESYIKWLHSPHFSARSLLFFQRIALLQRWIPLLVADSPFFFHHIDKHKRSF